MSERTGVFAGRGALAALLLAGLCAWGGPLAAQDDEAPMQEAEPALEEDGAVMTGVDPDAPLLTGETEEDVEVDVPEGSILTLHAAPESEATVTGELERGADVRNLGCRTENGRRWCRVETPSGEGWVVARFLRYDSGPGRRISVSTTPPPRSVEQESRWVVTGLAVGGFTGYRAGPSPRDRVLGGFPVGRPLRNHGCSRHGGRDWCQVSPLGGVAVSGWIERRYVEPYAPLRAEPLQPQSPGRVGQYGDEEPDVMLQQGGDLEVAFETGCSLFFTPDRTLRAASSRCTPAETLAADDAARRFLAQLEE